MQNSDFSSQLENDEPLDSDRRSFDVVLGERGELATQPQPQEQRQSQSFSQRLYGLNRLTIIFLGLFGLGAIALSLWGWHRWQYVKSFEETNNAFVVSDIAGVNVRVPGKVARVSIPEDKKVKKGALLVQLYPQQYQSKLNQTQANLQQAQADFKSAQQDLKLAQSKRDKSPKFDPIASSKDKNIHQVRIFSQQLRNHLRNFDPNFVRSQFDYNRFARLNQQGLISLNTLTKTKAYYERLRSQRNKLLERWQKAEERFLQAQLQVLQKQIERLETQIENLPTPTTENTQSSAEDGTKPQKTTSQTQVEQKKQKLLNQIEKLTARTEVVEKSQEIRQRTYEYELNQLKVKTAKEIIGQLQTKLKAAKYQLASTKIFAPANGKIGITQVESQEKVKAGQTLMSLIPDSRWIAAHFESEQLANIKPGQPVEIKINNLSTTTLTGKVKKISNSPSESERSQSPDDIPSPVKISLNAPTSPEEKMNLVPGTPVDIKVKVRD